MSEARRRELLALKAYDRVWVDPMGNLLAKVGRGPRLIAIDAHIDTVGLGDRSEWKHDPYKGKVANRIVYGRGAGEPCADASVSAGVTSATGFSSSSIGGAAASRRVASIASKEPTFSG